MHHFLVPGRPPVAPNEDVKPLRILHVAAPAPAGGLETVLQALVPAQVERGDVVSVAAVVVPGDTGASRLFEAMRHLSVDLDAVELPARAYVREARALARIIRSRRPTVVHTHGYRSDVVAGIVAGSLGRPRVSTVHGFIGGDPRGRLYERAQRRMLRRFEAVVAVSAPLVSQLEASGIAPQRIHLVRNAWKPSRPPFPREQARAALGLEDGGPSVAWVGRLSREKAPDVALRAFALVRSDAELSVVGEGPMMAELRALARNLGVSERVRFLGLREGMGGLMRAFDALLLSSHTEGTPMVLLEAMAAGVPIVATQVGGVPDLVGGFAELAPPGRPEALAAALSRVLSDPDRAADLARRAERRVAESFATGPWADAYDRVYRAVAR